MPDKETQNAAHKKKPMFYRQEFYYTIEKTRGKLDPLVASIDHPYNITAYYITGINNTLIPISVFFQRIQTRIIKTITNVDDFQYFRYIVNQDQEQAVQFINIHLHSLGYPLIVRPDITPFSAQQINDYMDWLKNSYDSFKPIRIEG